MNRLLKPLFVLVWSSGFLAGTLGTRDTPPLALCTWRFLVAAAVLLSVALLTGAPWPRSRRAWRDLIVTGALLQAVQFGAAYTAVALGVPAGLAALVLCLSPVLVAVASGPVLGERLGRLGVVGSAVAVAGALFAGAGHLDVGGSPLGMALLLVGLLGFAGGTLYQKRFGATMDLRTGTVVQLLAGAVVLAPLSVVMEGGMPLPTGPAGFAALAWLAVANSIGGVVLLFVLLRRGTGAGVSGLLYLVPAVTAVLAVPALGQPVDAGTLAGLALTLAGVALVNRDGRSVTASPPHRELAAARRG
jgi:drug/metabolite transporter (DMT)-like permease